MKRNYIFNAKIALACLMILTGCISIFAQKSLDKNPTFSGGSTLAEEVRPFDFHNRYYYENGIQPGLIFNRRDGNDRLSILDMTDDYRFRNVRITAVYPAYDAGGSMVYWNLYGEIYKESFRNDAAGDDALAQAEYYPMFVFPSDFVRERLRQANVIDLKTGYFEKNPLGLSVQVEVRYTARVNGIDGQKELSILAEKNGLSLDGTPIIKTIEEIQNLTRKGFVTQLIKGVDNPSAASYIVGKVIQRPEAGAIAPDAFLVTIQREDGERFHADTEFLRQFNCLKDSTNCSR